MDWSNEDSLQLIEQYRLHTELWDRSDPKYKDKMCRFRGWSEIADSFGCTKAEVERKMNVLLTQYRREKHKMLMKRFEGMPPGTSKWYAFKNFAFLENVTSQSGGYLTSCGMIPKPRKRKSNLSSGPNSDDNIFAGVSRVWLWHYQVYIQYVEKVVLFILCARLVGEAHHHHHSGGNISFSTTKNQSSL